MEQHLDTVMVSLLQESLVPTRQLSPASSSSSASVSRRKRRRRDWSDSHGDLPCLVSLGLVAPVAPCHSASDVDMSIRPEEVVRISTRHAVSRLSAGRPNLNVDPCGTIRCFPAPAPHPRSAVISPGAACRHMQPGACAHRQCHVSGRCRWCDTCSLGVWVGVGMRGGGRRGKVRSKPGKRPVTRSVAQDSAPEVSLELIHTEDVGVKRELARLGVGLRDVEGDGNCLFRALGDQLWGDQKRHPEVRKLVCDFLERSKEDMLPYFASVDESYDQYVARMRQFTVFGTGLEVQAAARVFQRDIRIVTSTSSFTVPWRREGSPDPAPAPADPSAGGAGKPRRRTRSSTNNLLATPSAPPPSSPSYATALAEYIPAVRPGRSMLWLALFSMAEHYQSVRRKGDGGGAAEIEDRLAIYHEMDNSEAARRARGETITPAKQGINGGAAYDRLVQLLPPSHGLSAAQIKATLGRTRGDIHAAHEILLEELALHDGRGDDDGGPDGAVPVSYREPSPTKSSTPTSAASHSGDSTNPTTPEDDLVKADNELDGLPDLPVKLKPESRTRHAAGSRRV